MDSLFRWAGSKKALVPTLTEGVRVRRRYFEPFVGSGCVYFALSPVEAVLGDINKELVGTYRVIKTAPHLLWEAIRRLPSNSSAYYRVRDARTEGLTPVERAARFIYLNHFCFNGIYRTNRTGRFNVPRGRIGPRRIASGAIFEAAKALAGTKVLCGDFETVCADAGDGDFVYLDPPYYTERRRVFVDYSSRPFGAVDFERLERMLDVLNLRGAQFVLSYADCPEGRALARPWAWERVRVNRTIAGDAKKRRGAFEIIARNF
jgi:DNA adenine methylase